MTAAGDPQTRLTKTSMKRCPNCQRSYEDDTLNFCLYDGTPLSQSEEETVIRSTFLHPEPHETPNRRVSQIYAYVLIALLALLLGGGGVFLFLRRPEISLTPSANPQIAPNVNAVGTPGNTNVLANSESNNQNAVNVTNTVSESKPSDEENRLTQLPAIVKFVGKYPYELLKSRHAVKQRLRHFLGPNFSKFDGNLSVQGQFTIVGGVMIATGCAPHSCGTEEAALAIDLSTGSIKCAVFSQPFDPKTDNFTSPGSRHSLKTKRKFP